MTYADDPLPVLRKECEDRITKRDRSVIVRFDEARRAGRAAEARRIIRESELQAVMRAPSTK